MTYCIYCCFLRYSQYDSSIKIRFGYYAWYGAHTVLIGHKSIWCFGNHKPTGSTCNKLLFYRNHSRNYSLSRCSISPSMRAPQAHTQAVKILKQHFWHIQLVLLMLFVSYLYHMAEMKHQHKQTLLGHIKYTQCCTNAFISSLRTYNMRTTRTNIQTFLYFYYCHFANILLPLIKSASTQSLKWLFIGIIL